MPKTAVLFLVLLIGCSAAGYATDSRSVGLELSVGGLVGPDVFVSEDMVRFYGTASAGLNVPLLRRFDVGFWFGYLFNSPYLPAAREDGIWPLAYPMTYGLKAVVGDRKNGVALSVNFGVTPSIGVYYRNWFINGFIGLIETTAHGPTSDQIDSSTKVYPYIELGRCFDLRPATE